MNTGKIKGVILKKKSLKSLVATFILPHIKKKRKVENKDEKSNYC